MASIDLALLRVIKYKEQYDKVARYIPMGAINKRTKLVAKDIGRYFEENDSETMINFNSFRSLFFTSYHRKLNDDDTTFYNAILTKMEADVPDGVRNSLINQLLELEFATDLGNLVNEYQAGDEVDIVSEVTHITKKLDEQMVRANSFEYADLDDSSVEENDDVGLKWCLPELNERYRNIQGGDQTIVCARPGLGKTTFLTCNNVSMVEDMKDTDIIVWFNNESRRQRIMKRQMQSALRKTNDELSAMQIAGTLNEEYIKVMGRKDRVRVYDIHGKNNLFLGDILESILKEGLTIGAIVIDMLDNVKFPTRRELREDQRLEEMYKWFRELGVEYNCPTFPTSQVSNEGAGLMYPLQGMLKDSKTGKQGACDNILMIGWDEDTTNPNARGISMPKTKTLRAGQQPLVTDYIMDGDRGIYK
jgi:replicative DNA helicase